MKENRGDITFPMMGATRKDCLASALLIAVLIGVCGGLILFDGESQGKIFVIFVLVFALFSVVGTVGLWGISSITVNKRGISLSIGPIVLKKYSAGDIRTVAKYRCDGRVTIHQLIVLTAQASDIEALGEKALRKSPFRQELKFRENRPDWENICLARGMEKMRANSSARYIWMEFTPERQRLLCEMFPNAVYREAKSYFDPPSI